MKDEELTIHCKSLEEAEETWLKMYEEGYVITHPVQTCKQGFCFRVKQTAENENSVLV